MTAGPSPAFWNGKRVLVTGHTGFKGSWLCLWLNSLGARVHGFALQPPTKPSLYTVGAVEKSTVSSTIADIRDRAKLTATVLNIEPEIVFHLAAQPLVRHSYEYPVDTYEVNVMGVVHLLEAIRQATLVKAVVNVTTDKCYASRESPRGYSEHDAIGGRDPYSSSKGCAELVTAAYRHSFLADAGVSIATARAGNVIGGGDWSRDRLLPDIFRAIESGTSLAVRHPDAIRPWQHVLEPLSGYLTLAERLYTNGATFAESWNFGPSDEDARTVSWIVERVALRDPKLAWHRDGSSQPPEAHALKLDSSKARARLGWRPRWDLSTALNKTCEWHHAWRRGHDMRRLTLTEISDYSANEG